MHANFATTHDGNTLVPLCKVVTDVSWLLSENVHRHTPCFTRSSAEPALLHGVPTGLAAAADARGRRLLGGPGVRWSKTPCMGHPSSTTRHAGDAVLPDSRDGAPQAPSPLECRSRLIAAERGDLHACICEQRLTAGEWFTRRFTSRPAAAQAKQYGPGISGALFGAGWWFWLDAIGSASIKIPFKQVDLCPVHDQKMVSGSLPSQSPMHDEARLPAATCLLPDVHVMCQHV